MDQNRRNKILFQRGEQSSENSGSFNLVAELESLIKNCDVMRFFKLKFEAENLLRSIKSQENISKKVERSIEKKLDNLKYEYNNLKKARDSQNQLNDLKKPSR
ncbi:MAG TPA: hypothetical protein PLZ05_01695 [Alphaproteobacteria bacterium]|nr:hypothetical protein [Alphaproteobacteria bacterium]